MSTTEDERLSHFHVAPPKIKPIFSVETLRLLFEPGRNPVVSVTLSVRDVSQLLQDYRLELTGS